MRKHVALLALAGGIPFLAAGQTVINGGRAVSGTWDAGNAASTRPAKTGTVLPAACAAGSQFFKTDAPAGQNLYFCTAANTWTQMTGATGGTASPLTTKGDLFGHSNVDVRVPVGSDGQVLTADSTQAAGVKWAAAPSSVSKLTVDDLINVAGENGGGSAIPGTGVSISGAVWVSNANSYFRTGAAGLYKSQTNPTIYMARRMPSNYDGGEISLSMYRNSGYNTGNVVWQLSSACLADGSAWPAAEGDWTLWTTVIDNFYNGTPSQGTLSFGNRPSPCAAGQRLLLRVTRLTTDANDTMSEANKPYVFNFVLTYKVNLE